MGSVWDFDHGCKVVQKVQLCTLVLVIASNQKVHIVGALKRQKF